MSDLQVSLADLRDHQIHVATDFIPPIEHEKDRRRLSAFGDTLAERFPAYYAWMHVGPDGLKCSTTFKPDAVPDFVTLQLGGPRLILTFPLVSCDPAGNKVREFNDYRPMLTEVQRVLFEHFGARQRIWMALTRQLLFDTGREPATPLLTANRRLGPMPAGAGELKLIFCDDRYDCHINLVAGGLQGRADSRVGSLPIPIGQGLAAKVAFFRHATTPMTDAEMADMLDQADGLWPDRLLGYVNRRSPE